VPPRSGQSYTEGHGEAARVNRQAHGRGEGDQLCRRESLRQPPNYFVCYPALPRPLFGEAQNILLQLVVGSALLELVEFLDLASVQAGLLTEGLVVVESVVAVVQLDRLQVGQFVKFRVEIAAARLRQ